MTKSTLRSISVACLFLGAIFFLPCFTREVRAQDTDPPGLFGDDDLPGLTPQVSAQDMGQPGFAGDDENFFVAHPSRLLGKELPKKVNLRSELPPVGDQGDVWSQSCVTFATVYYQMTQCVKHSRHPEWDLKNPEHQFSVRFIYEQGGSGNPTNAYDLLRTVGCVDNADMQYSQTNGDRPTAEQFEAAKPYRISAYTPLWDHKPAKPPYDPPNPIQNAKAWLADGHVLVVSIDPNSPGFPGSSGKCTPPTRFYDISDSPWDYSPGHEVTLCGYHDNVNPNGKGRDHRGGFLMVNSEGPDWNGKMRGYIWLSYAYVKRYIGECYVMTMDGASDAPVITGYTVQVGGNGPEATISGTNFGSRRRSAGVTFNDVRAYRYVSWTNESVTVLLSPLACASAGPVVVTNWEDTPSNPFPFEAP